jgi:hypothetical protein
MKIYYYTSSPENTRLLVEHEGKGYLVNFTWPDDPPHHTPVLPILMMPGDDIQMAFERFFKFALEPWRDFEDNFDYYEAVIEQTKAIIGIK